MSAPDPSILSRLAQVHEANLAKAVQDYTYLYSCAYSRASHGDGERVSTGATPDVSGLLIGSVGSVKHHLQRSARSLFRAEREIQGALADLSAAMTTLDDKRPLSVEQHERAIAHPADRGDVDRAHKAQARRAVRMDRRTLPWSREEVCG